MIPRSIRAQREFGGGQIDASARRRDDQDFLKTGGRQMSNWRRRSTGSMEQRPGRRAVFKAAAARLEYFRMAPGYEYFICFADNQVIIYDPAGNVAFSNTDGAYLWTSGSSASIVWCQAQFEIIICFPGMQPQVLTWDRAAHTWSASAFTFVTQSGIVKEPFYRFSIPGATMTYSGTTGSVTLTCSKPYFTAAMIGSRLSILGCQVTLTAVADSTHATATVANKLPDCAIFYVNSSAGFMPGQVAKTSNTNTKIEVGSVGTLSAPINWWNGSNSIVVPAGTAYVCGCMMSPQSYDQQVFNANNLLGPSADLLVGPSTKTTMIAQPNNYAVPQPTVQWAEEFMSAHQGWPQGCAYDAGRIIFYDFPQMPDAVLWGSLYGPRFFWIDSTAATTDTTAGADASSAILEFVSPSGRTRPRVRHVVGWGDEFVFTDSGIFYVPISSQNPLKPGSVELDHARDGRRPWACRWPFGQAHLRDTAFREPDPSACAGRAGA
ncbi:hypothetical protein M2322_000632 [Rhodoblastus acidophilus]|uniref:hypothetical protein n=1 Tax=Rhodoblastus acidophilus TaxID=1074 RepID=UPI002224F4C0|nr:hypothetical protein [Rhodoblastus acidophilus]MCW2315112.1 hypothetical protein [Rhodoblastus acidophilus]